MTTKKTAELFRTLKDESIDEMVEYDVKDEFYDILAPIVLSPMINVTEETKPLVKMYAYRQLANIEGFDCDVSLRSILIYLLAFAYVRDNAKKISRHKNHNICGLKHEIQTEDVIFRGDTMNSFATGVHAFFKSREKSTEPPADILLNVNSYFDILPNSAKEYIRLSHTIGNFIPIPSGYDGSSINRPRGIGHLRDYWDLFMFCVWKWYSASDDMWLVSFLKTKKNAALCKNWLKKFGSWECFLTQNYLQDYVNDDMSPTELFDGHFLIGESYNFQNVSPKTKEQFDKFFSRSSKRILLRGERISNAVKENLTEENMEKILNMLEE